MAKADSTLRRFKVGVSGGSLLDDAFGAGFSFNIADEEAAEDDDAAPTLELVLSASDAFESPS